MKFIKQLLLLSLIAIPFALNAQSTGQWIIHPKFVSTDMTNCIDTGDKVYYLTSNTLYCYDKETQENAVYLVVSLYTVLYLAPAFYYKQSGLATLL